MISFFFGNLKHQHSARNLLTASCALRTSSKFHYLLVSLPCVLYFNTASSKDPAAFQYGVYVGIFRSPCCRRLLRLRTTKKMVAQTATATTPLTTTITTKLVEKDWDSPCSSASPKKRKLHFIVRSSMQLKRSSMACKFEVFVQL